jgi:hypothetical protein
MNNRNCIVAIGEFSQGPKGLVVDIALAQECEYLALGLQKRLHDCLDMGTAKANAVADGRDLNLAVTDGVGLSWRATNLSMVSTTCQGQQNE